MLRAHWTAASIRYDTPNRLSAIGGIDELMRPGWPELQERPQSAVYKRD
jgi:hypothetical protein